jgi:serine/threonine protein kinase
VEDQPKQLGNYRLLRRVGEGGFADVYLGEHAYLQTVAAVKILHTHLADEKGAQFYQEAQTIARLIHPHIVRVLDFGVDGGTPFLIMDYAPYGTLRQAYPRETQYPLETLLPLVRQIATALAYAHAARVVHCDLKPENVLLGRDQQLWLSDFGIAVVAHRTYSMTTQAVVGTVTYMAPEQLRGKPRPASDQYALAIMLYEWLCGAPPFDGTSMEIAMQHLVLTPPPMRTFGAAVSPDVEAVIRQALHKDPKQRFPDVQAFVTALEEASRVPWEAPAVAIPTGTPLSENLPITPIDLIETKKLPAQPLVPQQAPTPPTMPTVEASTFPDTSRRRPSYPTLIWSTGTDVPPRQRRKKFMLIFLAAALLLALALTSLALLLPGSPMGSAALTNTATPSGASPSPGTSSTTPGTSHTPAPGVTATPPPGATPGVTPTTPPGSTPTNQPDPTVPTDPPVLEVSSTSLAFTFNLLNCLSTPTKNVALRNTGGGVVNWQATIEQPKYLHVNPTSGNIDDGNSNTITISLVCSAITINLTDYIFITWNDGQQITITVTIQLL